MVFQQRVIDDSADSSIQSVRERVTQLLTNLAPFSYLIESGEYTAAFCWLAVGDDFWFWGGRSEPVTASLETSVENAIATFKNQLNDEGASPSIFLHTVLVLSDTDQTNIGLSSVEEAVPGMDGTGLFFDAAEGRVTFQNWWEGDRDSGFLGAEEDGGDIEYYTRDPSPGREYLVEVISTLAGDAPVRPRSAA
jgi:hypothetical protein